MKVHYLYTTKFLFKNIAKYMDPNRCESGEEFDQEFLRSPVWRNSKRFVSFDEFLYQNILEQCKHNTEFHVILNEKMKIGQILEMKQIFSRSGLHLLQISNTSLVHEISSLILSLFHDFYLSFFTSLNNPVDIFC
ncbi:hypothetical protein CAEBREN_14877 [Caenorhabditis brenneri]|uniref:Uncharacterized protein n=1 Tax=Caenorhabditis brenneri TaxID=135651 RepID=G0N7G7_CAEBE|nr:hypothetical protein CAEBREN_14877 [Caenorhabditis brenneri]